MKPLYWIAPPLLLLSFSSAYAQSNSACDANDPLVIISATDDGLFEETHGPENTIDGDFDPDSRLSLIHI